MANTVRVSGNRGARLDLQVRRGRALTAHRFTMTNEDGTPYNFTGRTLVARARTRAAVPVVVPMTLTVVGALTSGVVDLGMTSAASAALPAGPHVTSPPVVSDWEFFVQDTATGEKTPVFFGELEVHGSTE